MEVITTYQTRYFLEAFQKMDHCDLHNPNILFFGVCILGVVEHCKVDNHYEEFSRLAPELLNVMHKRFIAARDDLTAQVDSHEELFLFMSRVIRRIHDVRRLNKEHLSRLRKQEERQQNARGSDDNWYGIFRDDFLKVF